MQSWKTLTAIQIGGALCLPVLMVGQQLATDVGFFEAVCAIIIGNALLCAVALLIGPFGARYKMSTIDCAEKFLGTQITYLVAASVAIASLGWFALQLDVMVEPFLQHLSLVETNLLRFFLGAAITLGTIRGVSAIGMLADYAVPIFGVTLLYAIANSSPSIAYVAPTVAIDPLLTVIALSLAAIVDLPTFFRFARSEWDARLSAVLLCCVALPAIEIAGAYIGIASGKAAITDALIGSGGTLWHIWIVLFLILAGWTTNNANIYTASVSLRHLIPGLEEKSALITLGLLGTVLSCCMRPGSFCVVIEFLALPVIPIGFLIAYTALRDWLYLPEIDERRSAIVVGAVILIGLLHMGGVSILSHYLLIDAAGAALSVLIISAVQRYCAQVAL